jgi:hypothetical protein
MRMASIDERNINTRFASLTRAKAFPSQLVPVYAPLFYPMSSDSPSLAGLGRVFLGCNDHRTRLALGDQMRRAREALPRPR